MFVSLFFTTPTAIMIITQLIDAEYAACGKLIVYRYVRAEVDILLSV
jgi:hypothetical protein